jgi:hypothetical protein
LPLKKLRPRMAKSRRKKRASAIVAITPEIELAGASNDRRGVSREHTSDARASGDHSRNASNVRASPGKARGALEVEASPLSPSV